jgi:DNA mismatch repair protein MutL
MLPPEKSSRIQILNSNVVDQIAAGEVVERPAQLVKELVENSLDAAATKVSVEFSEAGRFVRVTDNGRGIHPEDLAKALDRFATSKIIDSEDLWRLKTFGFRGEALASISAVCRLTLVSRRAGSADAHRLISDFGRRETPEIVGAEPGTMVQVEGLFENIPARLKFLKSASAEHSAIKTVLKALALSNPGVEFRVLLDGNLTFLWPQASSRLARARQVLEIQDLYEGEATRESVRAYSVFAAPHTTAKSSKNMWFLVQDRWVQDRGLQAGVMEAYRHLLMHGEYPISVTWVETDPDKIDVNIHPTKAQIKFLDPSLAFRAVQASVRDTLEKSPWLKTETNSSGQMSSQISIVNSDPGASQAEPTEPRAQNFFAPEFQATQYRQKISIENLRDSARGRFELQKNSGSESLMPSPSLTDMALPVDEKLLYWSQMQVLGQAHLTYILAQSRDGLMIVDQHAAHERVLFEKLMKAFGSGGLEIQDFLFPLAVDLSPDQLEALLKESSSFEKLGLHFESLGPTTLGVQSAPHFLRESALPGILTKAAEEILSHGGSFSFERYVGDLVATMACHSAIRAGQALSQEEMQALLKSMDEYPLSSFCPHGRPVSIDYPISKLERDFGRTV